MKRLPPSFSRFFSVTCVLLAAPVASAQFTWSGAGADAALTTASNWAGGVSPTFTGSELGSTNTLIFNNAVNTSVNMGNGVRRGVSNITFVGPSVGAFDFSTNTGRWVLSYGGKILMDSATTNSIKIGRLGFGTNAGGGSYTLENNAALSSVVISNTSFTAANTNTSTIILTGSNTGTNRFDNASGNVAIVKNGSGRWDLSSVTTTGGATINAGTVGLSGNNALGGGAVTINGGVTIGSVTSARSLSNNVSVGGDFQLGGLGQSTTLSGSLNLGGATRTITLGNSATFSGSITNGALVVSALSSPNFTLSGSGSTFNSLTIGSAVNLQVGSDTALGSAALVLSNASISANGAARIITNAITLNGDLGLNTTGGANLLTIASALDLGSSAHTVTVTTNSVITGIISGAGGSLIKAGSGLVALGGANTFSGGTTINAGTLTLSNASALGSGAVSITAGVLDLNSLSITNSVNFSGGTITNGSLGASAVTATAGTLAATLGGTSSLLKSGAGTVIINAANTYSGGTVVQAGTLTVNSTNGSGTGIGTLTVSSGATLNGSGIIGSDTTIAGTHGPGNSPGLQTFTNGLTYLGGSTFVWEINANTVTGRGTSFDAVDVTGGTLTINTGVTNNLVFNAIGSSVLWSDAFWDSSQSWLVFSNASSPSLESLSVFDTVNVSLDSVGNDLATERAGSGFAWSALGNDVYLNYTVPEPSTYSLLGIAAAALAGHCIRRRKRSRS